MKFTLQPFGKAEQVSCLSSFLNFFLGLCYFSKTVRSFEPTVFLGPIPWVFRNPSILSMSLDRTLLGSCQDGGFCSVESEQKFQQSSLCLHGELVLQNYCDSSSVSDFSKSLGFQNFPASLLSQAPCPPIFSSQISHPAFSISV